MTEEEFNADNATANGGKKPMDKKKKKILIIACIAAATALVITLSILIPILVINAPKQFISEASDFNKEIKDSKDYYVMNEDVIVEGDLNLVMSVDMNDKSITASGTITIKNTREAGFYIGTRDGEEYIEGGQIKAAKIIFSDMPSATVLSNVVADEIIIQNIAAANFTNGMHVSNSLEITKSNIKIDTVVFGENVTAMNMNNSKIDFTGDAIAPINSINSKIDTQGSIGNATLDSASELRVSGMVYADAAKVNLGTITGGKLVLMRAKSSVGVIDGATEVWIARDSNTIGEIKNVPADGINYIKWLSTPVAASVNIIGTDVIVNVPAVSDATRIAFYIDNIAEPIIMDIREDNKYTLTEQLNTVGAHNIRVVMMADEIHREFVIDSEPLDIAYNHIIILDMVSNARVEIVAGDYILKFDTVKFADTYEIIFDTVKFNISNVAEGTDQIEHNLSLEAALEGKLTVGSHIVKIVSKNGEDINIKSSSAAIADFAPIEGKIETVVVTLGEIKDDVLNINWTAPANATRYMVYVEKADGTRVLISNTPALSYNLIIGEDVDYGDKVYVIAVGAEGYNDSDESIHQEVIISVE